MNRNWEEEVDVPVGPDNNISPGVPDQGQPTHFLPRRNRFVFKVRVPADWGKKELIWTLTTKGKTERAYATLREDSMVDNIVQASEQGALGGGIQQSGNSRQHGARPDDRHRRATRADRPAADAGCGGEGRWCAAAAVWSRLARGRASPLARGRAPPTARRPAPVARGTMTFDPAGPASTVGDHRRQPDRVASLVFRVSRRRPRDVHAEAAKVWEDTRAGANSPWAPRWFAPAVPAGRPVPGGGDVRGSGHLHDSLPGVGWRAEHHERYRGEREVTSHSASQIRRATRRHSRAYELDVRTPFVETFGVSCLDGRSPPEMPT